MYSPGGNEECPFWITWNQQTRDLMWQLAKHKGRILWVASSQCEGHYDVGLDAEPLFAGYISEREWLWGAGCLRDFDAWWLPQLAAHSLLVPHVSLSAFSEECQRVLANVEKVALESKCDIEDVRLALQNFIRVSAEAGKNSGWLEIRSTWPPHPAIPVVYR